MRRSQQKRLLELSQAEQSRSYALRYELTYQEAYEAFSLLADKRGKKWRYAAFAAIGVAAAISLALLLIDPRGLQYSMLTVLCAALMLYVMYWPAVKARRGARAVTRSGGSYRYQLGYRRGIVLDNGQAVPLNGDLDARAIESGTAFIIRTDRQNSFCIPKRILTEEEVPAIRRLLSSRIPNTRLETSADADSSQQAGDHAACG
ncbi:MAG: YcxB family protein [Propionibacteriaceae bacterium]|jgi:hypothetical protein|nr:YcxB family protein [Propionibacteriaceae bacterium]